MTTTEMEHREWEMDKLEIRGHGESQMVRGQGVPFDRMSEDMGGWREVIRAGAATQSLKENDIAMLWAHDQTQPVSRVSATRHALELEERKSGVWFTQAAAAFTEFQLQKISDGVVQKMSFGFFVEDFEKDQKWTEGGGSKAALREIFKMKLREISPVVFPAYPSTKVAVRSAAACGIVLPGLTPGRSRTSVGSTTKRQDRDAARREFARDMARLEAVVQRGVRKEAKPPVTRRPTREYPSKAAFHVLLGNNAPTIRATAFHEAGHAVAGFVGGSSLEAVSLYSARRSWDHAWCFAGGKCLFRQRATTALVYVAGAVAEELAGFPPEALPSRWRDSDETRAAELTRHGVREDSRAAQSLLRRHWAAVQALAYRLLDEPVVDGRSAEEIILANLDANTRVRLRGRVA